MFDAYTVKKVLPRLVAAIVLIQLSWFLFTTLIQLTNMVAYGLEALLAAPFGGIQNLDLVSTLNTAGIDGPAFTFVFAAGLGVAGFVVGSLAIFVMIALLVGFIVLAIRRVILVALLVLAPLALVAWILPGTQRFWKLYWENFTKLLIMFPLILLMITAGKILAQVIALQMGSDQGLAQPLGLVLILVCFFAPFFLIPQTYKAAGAGLAFAAGWVGGQANRGEGAAQKWRGERSARKRAEGKAYGRFSDRNRLTRGMNTLYGAAMNPRDIGRSMVGKHGIRRAQETGRVTRGSEAWKSDRTIQANQFDDNFLLALADEDLAKRKLAQADAQANDMSLDQDTRMKALHEAGARRAALERAQQVGSRRTLATQQMAFDALTKTGYQYAAGEQGYQELESTARKISGGDIGTFSSLMNQAQYNLKGAGRSDLGGLNHGADLNIKSGIRKLNSYARGQGKTDTYVGGAQAWLGSGAVGTDGKTTQQTLLNAMQSGSTSMDEIAEWQGMLLQDMPGATDANKVEIRKQLEAIDAYANDLNNGPTPTDPAQLEAITNFVGKLQQNKLGVARGIDPSEMDKIVNPPAPPGT